MARPGKAVFFTVLGLTSALSVIGYFQIRTTWRTATEAEVRRAINPSLLEETKTDPAARDRYDRMVEVVSKVKNRIDYGSPKPESIAAFLRDEKPRLEALEKILAEGPMERPLPSWDPDTLVPSARITILIKMLARAGQTEANAGRTASAAQIFRLALRLSYSLAGHHVNKIDIIMESAYANEAIRKLYPVLSKFDEQSLGAIAQAIPPATPVDTDYRRAIRLEFQGLMLPMLADPRVWNRKMNQVRNAPADDDLVGSYDALETALFMSNALMATTLNAGRRRHEFEDIFEPRARFLRLTLPNDQSAGATGLWVPIRKFQYRIQMARAANSFARLNFFPTLEGDREYVEASLRTRMIREGTHTLLALHRYRLRYGAPAPSLDRLIQTKLLAAPPEDYMGKGLLHYDPVRRRLWSVGQNGKDEGGITPRFLDSKAPDYVWATP